MKNRGSTPIFTNLVGAHLRNINTKLKANPCSGSREEVKMGYYIVTYNIVINSKYMLRNYPEAH